MSARPEDIARINAWLGVERNAEDILAELRNLVCDVVWAGDGLHADAEALDKHAPKGFVLGLADKRATWREVGGQRAIESFDALASELTDVLGVIR